MIFFKIFFFILLFFSISIAQSNIDSITLSKIKKSIQKEEEIALAYKKYLLKNGVKPLTIEVLIADEIDFLPNGFSAKNPFGGQLELEYKDEEVRIKNVIPENIVLATNIYDYYYSKKNRTNTKASLGIKNKYVEILLSLKERFIFNRVAEITTTPNPKNKYYLDTKGVLHWYDNSGNYKYSINKEILVNLDDIKLVDDVAFAGQMILKKNNENAEEYLAISSTNIIKINNETKDIGKTIIQFSRLAGGMIVNGDIYTWGNNANKITGINLPYTGETGINYYPVITGLVRVKAKIYDDDSADNKDLTKFYKDDYFSSPLRPKFIDFFSTVSHGTCGISTKGELFCGGTTGLEYHSGNNYTQVDNDRNGEMLYRSTFFDGTSNKAKKIFANYQFWSILGNDGYLYGWGFDPIKGFGGKGNLSFNLVCDNMGNCNYQENIPVVISPLKFLDITHSLTMGHKKIAALSTTGDIHIWGNEYLKDGSEDSYEVFPCNVTWETNNYDLCTPTLVELSNSNMLSFLKFESIKGGLDAFVAKTDGGKYYKISHPKNKKIQVLSLEDVIKAYSEYNSVDDMEILSIDFSRKIDEQGKEKLYIPSSGVVWVNSKNELKGDYLTNNNRNDKVFEDAIKQIKWKQIKVIDDDNGMCGIDVNNQMYCWGMQSFYKNGSTNDDYMKNTFMLPVFNTNLYDLNKDFLVTEGGSSEYITSITSDEWSRSHSPKDAFFIKYPTYIGGFNYEYVFK